MTRATFDKLSARLKEIQEVEIPRISKAKQLAAEEGDLSENAEYQGCKEKLDLLHSQFDNLRQRIAQPTFIDDVRVPGTIVSIGTQVEIENEDGTQVTYKILGSEDVDIENNIISYTSPIAKGMIGKKPGDQTVIEVPEGKRHIKINSIKKFNV